MKTVASSPASEGWLVGASRWLVHADWIGGDGLLATRYEQIVWVELLPLRGV